MQIKEEIKVILVDDHNLFRNGLKLLLNQSDDVKVVAEAANGIEFLDLLNTTFPDVVLLDIEMPKMNGIDASREAIAKYPELKIISLSMYGEEEYYYKMIDAGVRGFILKNSDINEVIKAIKSVINGSTYFSSDVLYNVVKNIKTVTHNTLHSTPLSDREMEVLEQICRGLSNNEIADLLHISKRTVEKHRASLLFKTNAKNTANLVMFAIENKLVEL